MIASKLKPHVNNSPLPVLVRATKTPARAEAWGKKSHSCPSLPAFKPLAIEFQSKGVHYRQITRDGDAAIYEQTWSGCSNPTVSYEVVRIRRREAFQINGRCIEPAERYPNSEACGMDGFTFTNKDAAFAKLRELVAR